MSSPEVPQGLYSRFTRNTSLRTHPLWKVPFGFGSGGPSLASSGTGRVARVHSVTYDVRSHIRCSSRLEDVNLMNIKTCKNVC